jgi:type III secretion protein Y
MTPGRDQTVELLHALGHLYARHSQPKRGLVLLLIAARLAPNDEGVLRTLAEAFLRSRSPQAASEVIERLQALGSANQPMLDLLRSRALWLAGNESEAKRMFRKFLEHRERSSS